MSTKLYNGYKLNNLSLVELKEFMDEIKKRLHKVFVSDYDEMVTNFAMSMIDSCTAIDYLYGKTGDTTDIEKFFMETLRKAYSPVWIVNEFGKDETNLNLDYALNHFFNFDFMGSSEFIAKEMVKQKVFIGETKNTAIGVLDLQNEIALFPTDNKILFLAYGDKLETVLNKLLKSKKKDDREFCNKYGFEYYGFWNNTDRPSGISQKQWDARGKEWDDVLNPDYIPSLHGICSEFISKEQFLDEMELQFKFDGNYISPDSRAKNIAYQMVQKEWLKTKQVTTQNVYSLISEFQELEAKGTFAKEIDENYEELRQVLPVLTKESFSKKLLSYAPNYVKAKGLQ